MEAETSDEVLIARLRGLGYTLGLPSIDVNNETVGAASKDDEEAAEAARFARYRENAPTLLDRLLAAREAEASAVETEGDATETAETLSDDGTNADALQSLLDVVNEHRKSVQAATAEARRKKGRRDDRSGTRGSRASSLSPSKRLREPSPSSSSSSENDAESDSTGPTTPCPPAGRRRPRNRHLNGSSPTPAKRPPSSVKLAGLATLALFSTDAQAAAPFSPFVGAAHSLDEVVSNADFATVIQLAQNLQRNKALFDLAQSQASATGRQTGSNLNFLGKHLFSGSPVSPTNPARATLRLARLMNLDAKPDETSSPTNRSALPVLTTPRTTCIQCDSTLHLREHPDEPVWLVRPAQGAEQCLVAIYVCSNRACRARHAPDHVEISHQDRSVWLWDNEATAIKLGERTWTTTDGAAHLRHLLLQQAVTPGGFAQLWNRQYSDSAPEDDDLSSSSMRDLPDSDEDDLEEDEERPRRSDPGPSSSHKGKRGRDSPFRLRAAHLWRAIVISSCLRAVAQNAKYGRFASPVRPSTLDLVELANSCLFDDVLPPHQCATCTRPRQLWLGGPATDAERRAGIRWAGTQASDSKAFGEDVKLIDGPPVQMAVCDGITIGYFLCAAPGCPNSPEKHRRASRFCEDHDDLHELCGVAGCGRERSGVQSGGGLSEACDDPAHEERWLKFVRLRDENRDRGWRGRANEPRRRPENVAPPLDDVLFSDSEDDDAPESSDDVEASGSGGRKRLSHMWAMRKSSHLQLLVASCGTPLAWRSFTSGETVREVFDFLASVHQSYTSSSSDNNSPTPFPSYVAYDRACQVLRHAAAAAVTVAEGDQEDLPPFLKTSRLVVDSFHRQCHSRDDLLCMTLCNPAPLDGSAPDLVIPLRVAAAAKQSEKGSRSKSRSRRNQERETGRVFQRAFNTSAAEQLNSQLSRFAFVLAGMKAPNFKFLVHVLLRYRREEM